MLMEINFLVGLIHSTSGFHVKVPASLVTLPQLLSGKIFSSLLHLTKKTNATTKTTFCYILNKSVIELSMRLNARVADLRCLCNF